MSEGIDNTLELIRLYKMVIYFVVLLVFIVLVIIIRKVLDKRLRKKMIVLDKDLHDFRVRSMGTRNDRVLEEVFTGDESHVAEDMNEFIGYVENGDSLSDNRQPTIMKYTANWNEVLEEYRSLGQEDAQRGFVLNNDQITVRSFDRIHEGSVRLVPTPDGIDTYLMDDEDAVLDEGLQQGLCSICGSECRNIEDYTCCMCRFEDDDFCSNCMQQEERVQVECKEYCESCGRECSMVSDTLCCLCQGVSSHRLCDVCNMEKVENLYVIEEEGYTGGN